MKTPFHCKCLINCLSAYRKRYGTHKFIPVSMKTHKPSQIVTTVIPVTLIFAWPCIIDINNKDNQLDATIMVFLLIPIPSTCFGQSLCPSSGPLDCVLQFVVYCTHDATGRQHRGCIIPQAVTHSLVLLKTGKIVARNMLSWLDLLINHYCCI